MEFASRKFCEAERLRGALIRMFAAPSYSPLSPNFAYTDNSPPPTHSPAGQHLNGPMASERPQHQQQQQQGGKQPPAPKQEKGHRSGEGSRSVIPHLKADQRARAASRVAKSRRRDF